MNNINDQENIEYIRDLNPDVVFVFGFSQLIKKEILDIPPLGCIGTHPALLPKNRGRHPLIWALIDDLEESGLTFFYLDEGADSGDILWQKKFAICDEDDAGTLYDKIKALASEGIREFLPLLQTGSAQRIKQDHSQATYWRKRNEEDGQIDWAGKTRQAFNLIRGLSRPYIGAHTFQGKNRILIWRSRIIEYPEELPGYELAKSGQVMSDPEPHFLVRTGDGVLEVIEWESDTETGVVEGTIFRGMNS
jgi:methionyl-tRNA formyltransferase